MKVDRGRLTGGQATLLVRVSTMVIVVFALSGMLLMLAPLPKEDALRDVAQASTRRFVDYTFLFPRYRELTGIRATPFEFGELTRIQVRLRKKESEPPPPPKPDVSGLRLVGTVPGNSRALAVLVDEQSGKTTNIARGDEIRNSIVKDIFENKIVLALNAEEAELALTPVLGSENLSRQMQGLPPLAEPPAAENNQSQSTTRAAPPSPPPNQASGNAVLVGASSTAGGISNTVISQSPVSSTATPPQQESSSQPGSNPTPVSGSSPPLSPQNSAGGQSGSAPTQNQPPSSSPPGSQPRRSLGISGHMLSLEKQQELGLQETGLLVTAVRNSGSPIQANDVILTISGQSFGSLGEAKNLIDSVNGNTVQVQVFRNGASNQISAPLK